MATIHHFCAQNDVNGNPRRVYVLENQYGMVAAWDEGYLGDHAVPGMWRKEAYDAEHVNVSVRDYRKFLKLPSPDYAYEVKGYDHLRNM
jgi:hypothetical protein